ncbi:Fur family transcriptional regulator [Hyphococcus luteus]|jgi:Fur family zinc uptake transcriptional regulator|uniref:Transcriptional repressor n=1 Tax=Hyphococcus luteus TaxID=2058213 RepID=A0A2S7K5H8_9PROT|nr:transcriptional repressor [Marinicaulis flavus]PQA87765.1 transcriptional repressor [Marinicaulis flavus]
MTDKASERGKGDKPKKTAGNDNAEGEGVREQPAGLLKNEKLVWDALAGSHEPLKAYEILDKLKEQGVRAPMTVYRALDGLEEKGHIHKLDGMNAFVLCNHEGPHMVQTFLVCERCSTVQELQVLAVEADIAPAVRAAAFDMHTARLEIKGNCNNCAAA